MSEYTWRAVKGPVADTPFGRFGWVVLRPDGTVLLTTNSKADAKESAAKLNRDGHL